MNIVLFRFLVMCHFWHIWAYNYASICGLCGLRDGTGWFWLRPAASVDSICTSERLATPSGPREPSVLVRGGPPGASRYLVGRPGDAPGPWWLTSGDLHFLDFGEISEHSSRDCGGVANRMIFLDSGNGQSSRRR